VILSLDIKAIHVGLPSAVPGSEWTTEAHAWWIRFCCKVKWGSYIVFMKNKV